VIPGATDGQYEFGSFMSATLSCDHRVIDGTLLIHVRCLWTVHLLIGNC
jgi:pyruvate/2-oxoglutarate dehydrogenase complex dihydrolipoamide acyltransferase (E2) component